MALKKSVAIEVEARTEGAVQNIEKLANSTRRAREEVEKVDKRAGNFDATLQRIGGGGLVKAEAAMNKATTASRTLAVGLEQSKSGTLGLAQVATTAAAAFGPWGIAISVAGGALLSLVSSTEASAKAARDHAKARDEERKAVEDARASVVRLEFWTAANAAAEESRLGPTRERISQLEDEAARTRGLGESTADLEREISKLTAAEIRHQKAFREGLETFAEFEARGAGLEAQARAIERRQQLVDAEAAGAEERAGVVKITVGKRGGGGGGKPSTPKPTANNDFADKAAVQEWDALMDAREAQRLERKRSSDLEFKTMDERFNLIMEEQAAKAESEEKRRHEESLARIAEQQAAEEQLVARREELLGITAELANRGVELGNMVAHAAGVSAKKREKIANILGAAEAFTIGTLEVIKAAAAAAAYNWPQFALHTVAAAIAFTKGGMMSAAAGGGGVGVGGGAVTGSSLGGGSEPAANERPSTSNTQKDTTPVSESGLQQSGSTNSGSPSGSGKSFNFAPGSISVIGAIDDQSATKIAQGIRRAEQNAGKLAS